MAELAGTVVGIVGVVGVLGQIFDGCIKAYAFFTSASNLGRDSERLVCKIRIEEMRLLVWGREWGVIEGKLEAHLQKESEMGNERLRGLAVEILTELHRTITDFRRLKERYGMREERVEGNEVGKLGVSGSAAGRLRNELQLRAKWVIADKEKVRFVYVFTSLASRHLSVMCSIRDGTTRLAILPKCPTTFETLRFRLLKNMKISLTQNEPKVHCVIARPKGLQ